MPWETYHILGPCILLAHCWLVTSHIPLASRSLTAGQSRGRQVPVLACATDRSSSGGGGRGRGEPVATIGSFV